MGCGGHERSDFAGGKAGPPVSVSLSRIRALIALRVLTRVPTRLPLAAASITTQSGMDSALPIIQAKGN
jgi:hypothetical protein